MPSSTRRDLSAFEHVEAAVAGGSAASPAQAPAKKLGRPPGSKNKKPESKKISKMAKKAPSPDSESD